MDGTKAIRFTLMGLAAAAMSFAVTPTASADDWSVSGYYGGRHGGGSFSYSDYDGGRRHYWDRGHRSHQGHGDYRHGRRYYRNYGHHNYRGSRGHYGGHYYYSYPQTYYYRSYPSYHYYHGTPQYYYRHRSYHYPRSGIYFYYSN